jgi:hypothetical protein
VVLTMDCEPTTATSHPAATGPANWSAGEDAVLEYVEIAAQYGLPVTFFVHPEAAVAQAAMICRQSRQMGGGCSFSNWVVRMLIGAPQDQIRFACRVTT